MFTTIRVKVKITIRATASQWNSAEFLHFGSIHHKTYQNIEVCDLEIIK